MKRLCLVQLVVLTTLAACGEPVTPVTTYVYQFEHHPASAHGNEAWLFDLWGGGHCPPFVTNARDEEAWIAAVNAVLQANSIAPINSVPKLSADQLRTTNVDYEWPDHELGTLGLYTYTCENAAGRKYIGIWKISVHK